MGMSGDGGELIELLGLEPHPEGGWFRATWRAEPEGGARPTGSAVYYLLRAGERSLRHRIDATELWHHYLGGPVALTVHAGSPDEHERILGSDLSRGERPQIVVPPGAWQEAAPLGTYALMGCTVSPAFLQEKFELSS